MNLELWAICPDYPNYEASTLGRIRRRDNGDILKPIINKKGYSLVWVRNGFTENHKSVARLIMLAHYWGDLPRNGVVRYRDNNKQNCAYANLYWQKPSEKVAESWSQGKYEGRSVGSPFKSGPLNPRWSGAAL